MIQSLHAKLVLGAVAAVFGLFSAIDPTAAQTAVTPSTGMISWWPGDGNANDIVDGNNGSIVGPVTFAPGKVGQAFLFNGTTAYVSAGNASDLQVSAGDFTVEAWVYYNSLFNTDSINCNPAAGCDMSIADKMIDVTLIQANADGWRFLKQANNYFLFCFGGVGDLNKCGSGPTNSNNSVTSAIGSVTSGTWYHVVGVKAASSIAIYVNGTLAGQTTLGPFNDTNTSNLWIGAHQSVDASNVPRAAAFANGLIDEVALYNRALSAAEISAIYAADSAGKYKLTPVTIIVKPGVSPPVLTREGAEKIRVAILSNPNFDATQVNSDTIRIAGAAVDLHGRGGRCFTQDVNGDGVLDLVCDVKADGDIAAGTTILVLEAKTFAGQAIRGQQEIKIAGKGSDDDRH